MEVPSSQKSLQTEKLFGELISGISDAVTESLLPEP